MKCNYCNSDIDSSVATCPNCAEVLKQQVYKEEIGYSNNRAEGKTINWSQEPAISGYGFRDYNETRLLRAFNFIQNIGNQLRLDRYHVEAAQRLYRLVQEKNFVKGRHSKHVGAASLYTICRKEKRPYLLIDFSEILHTNMYILAKYFLKIVKVLNLELPPSDPSIYIDKFCSNLKFESKRNEIKETVRKLLKGMTKDWMSYGRRPASLCGAAIWIAAKIHGVKRTTRQIVSAVHICDETIRKRLEEFKETSLAQYTKEELENLELGDIDRIPGEQDPPSFIPFEKRKKIIEDKIKEKMNRIDGILSKGSEEIAIVPPFDEEGSPMSSPSKKLKIAYTENENLSEMDPDEAEQYILQPVEQSIKSILWHHMHREWIKEQDNKKQDTISDRKRPNLKLRSHKPKPIFNEDDPSKAVKNSSLGNNLDREELESLFNENSDDESINLD